MAASDEAMCCACVPSPMRGRCRGAADEVVDVNERPLIRLFSLRSKSLPLRHSRIGARLKKPSRLAFSYASRPTGGEKAFGSALPSNAPRSVGFSLGWRSCQQARRAQMTDEGAVILTCLVRSLAFPLIRQFSRWSNCHPLRQAHRRSAEKAKPFGFFLRLAPRIAASPRGKAFGRPHPMKQCAAPVFLPLLRGRWREAPDEVVDGDDRPPHQPLSGHKKTALHACRRGIAVVGNSFRSGTRALSLRLCGLRQGGGGCGWRRPFRRSALRGQLR